MTIIYTEQWKLHPNAIAHHSTKNKGFLRLAAIYRDMGVKNYQMILALHNPDLEHVDYFDPNLPIETQAAVLIEAKDNFWFYIRELVRAPGLAGRDPVMFRPNRAMISMYWLYFNHIMPIVVIGRQQGKSFGLDCLTEWLVTIRSKDSLINMLTKDRVLRSASIKRLKEIDKLLPTYVSRQTRHDANNTEEFTVKALNNQYLVHLPQRSKKAAVNLGRGLTSKDTFVDEGPFQPNIALSLPAAAAASTEARKAAEESGTPYGMIMITTAASKDDNDGGTYIYGLLMDAARWTESYYNLNDIDQLKTVIRKSSNKGKLRVNCTFSHRQLGFTDAKLEQWIEDALVTKEEADRDFRNIWTSGSDKHLLAKDVLKTINDGKRDPNSTKVYTEGYVLRWYVDNPTEYLNDNDVVYGLDTSDAIGNDGISLVMLSAVSGAVVAVGSFNETNLTMFSMWLLQLHLDNRKLVGIIERKSSGVAIIDYLIHGLHKNNINPFTRLYSTIVQKQGELEKNFDDISAYTYSNDQTATRNRKYVGYVTSGTGINSRNALYVDTFRLAVETNSGNLNDERLIDEVLGLTIRNGRVDHSDGGHDDHVVAYLLASYLLYSGNRLDFYGINLTKVLTKTKTRSAVSETVRVEQEDYRRRIVGLIVKLKNADSEVLMDRYSMELRMLNNKLILDANESFNVNQAIKLTRPKPKYHRTNINRMLNYM